MMTYAVAVAWLASRPAYPPGLVWTIIVGNALWTIESLLFLALGWGHPTTLGYVFVIAQALLVGLFAELQFVGLRRAGRVAA